jgi:hypothetical protein
VFVYHDTFAMATTALDRLLTRLEAAKPRAGEINPARLLRLLTRLGRQRYPDAISLARFHDALVFFRAFPPVPAVWRSVESLLNSFPRRMAGLAARGADLSVLDNEQLSGIVGTDLTAFWNYDEVSWLVQRFPRSVSIVWDDYEPSDRLAATLPRFVPLLEEDARVEADVAYRKWLQAASGGDELAWLIRQIARLPISPDERVEMFGALQLPIRWRLGHSRATRTLSRHPARKIFYHRAPLIQRRDVSLAHEMALPAFRLKKLSRREGEKIIHLCREATTVRYRELYGTSLGDPASVMQATPGRGVEMFLWGLLPERRLPLRAYQAGFTLKNGVPINYIEGISLFEWMEIGFNTFYAYRDGETAWIYAQALRMLHQVLGVTCTSVYPYQLGKDNEEAIQSGAFWFYRKLGFRPMRPELAKLAAREEKKIAANPSYRTPPATLRRLAQGHVVFELPGTAAGKWDRFAIRNLGYAVQHRLAEQFNGNAARMRSACTAQLARILGVRPVHWPTREQRAFESYAPLLSLILDLARWPAEDKQQLISIIRAKASSSDGHYAKILLTHTKLRRELLRLGSVAH